MERDEWTKQRYDEEGRPLGEPLLTPEEQAALTEWAKKTLIPDPVPMLPNWGSKSQARGDAWLDGDKPKRPVNKARGALFANLLVSDDMIADAQMRQGDE